MNAIESYINFLGVDTRKELPGYGTRKAFASGAINRSYYNRENDTRPPFIEYQLKFQLTEDKEVFENAAITGMKFYKGEAGLFSSYLIVAVGDRVLAGFVGAHSIDFFNIHTGLDPQWTHTFMAQALNIFTIKDGVNPNKYWNGNIGDPVKLTSESLYAPGPEWKDMPLSNLSVFAHGRYWVATKQNILNAGNFILAKGLTLEARENVLNFYEETYPSSGGGFTAPSEMGEITSVSVVPQSNELNGHGDVMVGCRNGFFSIAPNRKVRNEWTNDPDMQKHVFTGKGSAAHQSLAIFGNQIFYRDSDYGISSLNRDIAAYQQKTPLSNVSDAAFEYLEYDRNSANIQYCSSFATDKRLLTTVGHVKENSSLMGIHRYARGLVSMVIHRDESGNSSMAWEGMWTGPRVVAAAVIETSGIKRGVVASFDTDRKNRLYYIDEARRGEDITNGVYRKIKSFFTYKGIFFNDGEAVGVTKSKFQKAEALISNSDPTSALGFISEDGEDSYQELKFQLTDSVCGKFTQRIVSTQSETQGAYYYSFCMQFDGSAKVAKIAFSSSLTSSKGFDQTDCLKLNPPPCQILNNGVQCLNNFQYIF